MTRRGLAGNNEGCEEIGVCSALYEFTVMRVLCTRCVRRQTLINSGLEGRADVSWRR